MPQKQHAPTHDPVSSSERKQFPVKPSWKVLLGYGWLFAIALVLVQVALGFFSIHSLLPWLIGTPLCYLLCSFLSALSVTRLQEQTQKWRWGWISGLLTSLFGACLGSLVVFSFLCVEAITAFNSPPPPGGYVFGHTPPPPGLQMIASIFFSLIVLLVNFASVLLGMLGGLLGGFLKSCFSPIRDSTAESDHWTG